MGWGDAFHHAYQAASGVAKAAADQTLSSVRAAADAVSRAALAAADAAAQAARAAKEAAVAGATAARDAAEAGAHVVKQGAVAVAHGAGNVASFAGRSAADAGRNVAGMAQSSATAPYRAAKRLFAPASTPIQTVVEPCANTWAAKKKRLEGRQQLIKDGGTNPNPAAKAAAARLAANNDVVELARLSNDSYAQYDPNHLRNEPPPGWRALSDGELQAEGISPDLMHKSRAVIYKSSDDWPGGAKTVLAFKGTADLEDVIVDHDQAMGLETEQYQASVALGRQVSRSLGSDVQVTGHSLGGGKAQAAGIAGGLRGTMFNASGPSSDSTAGVQAEPGQFIQVRTTGDPVTGVQNSPALQTAIVGVLGALGMVGGGLAKAGDAVAKGLGWAGLSADAADYADKAFRALPRSLRNVMQGGNMLPPAQGTLREVPAIDDLGRIVLTTKLKGQHSIVSVINGVEQQKAEDLVTLGGM